MPARSPFPETEKKCPPDLSTFDVQSAENQPGFSRKNGPHAAVTSRIHAPDFSRAIPKKNFTTFSREMHR